jgi:anti-sigma-K factor RskA
MSEEADDIDGLAAEFALGTLDPGERAAVSARRLREPSLDAAIRAWEERLGPLAETVPSVAAPPGLFARIEAAIAGVGATPRVIDLERRLRRWRILAAAAGAIAASLAIVVGVREAQRLAEPQSFVAVLQRDAASPAFLVSIDLASRALTVTPVAAEPQPGRDYQLWLVSETLPAPRSLGLVRQAGLTRGEADAGIPPDVVRGATFAVSLEPAGGSPTGAPTGPVLFTGRLIDQGT